MRKKLSVVCPILSESVSVRQIMFLSSGSRFGMPFFEYGSHSVFCRNGEWNGVSWLEEFVGSFGSGGARKFLNSIN
ncbi:hypothetical protein M5689_013825 [Euphorbia peplus]|nr:hypothetical protein M5689_013825 [Euphorbia peplus]